MKFYEKILLGGKFFSEAATDKNFFSATVSFEKTWLNFTDS